jgi:hypothetical protein
MQQNSTYKYKFFGFILLSFLLCQNAMAHDADALVNLSKTEVASIYLQLGFMHIIPLGLDHILFVLSLFLLNPKLKPILIQASAFTIAHTITLGLAMYNIIKPPANIVEPVIALSILYVALENIFSNKLRASRIGIVFIFGLIHGMGFASVLTELGLPKNAYFSSLIMFNIGVELGQIAVIAVAYFLIGKLFSQKSYYKKYIVIPLSIITASIALYWVVERIFF